MRTTRAAPLLATLALAGVFAAACTEESAPARAQVLLVVDTNLPTVGQIDARDGRSLAAAVDTLRVDILTGDGAIQDTREIVAADVRDWPLSLGILPTPSGEARVRLRLFRALYATIGSLHERPTLEPAAEVTIDRIVTVTFPGEGVRGVRVKLDGDCMGVPSSFVPPFTTCLDADNRSADPGAGAVVGGDVAALVTEAGSWHGAAPVECSAAPPAEDAVCIRGGFGILGDLILKGIEGLGVHDATPLRPVLLSPFYIDRTEFTVGRLRKLGASAIPNADEELVVATSTNDATFLGFEDASNDRLPLNHVTWETARVLCQKVGGDLPSEAQFEYTTRGRGEQRAYSFASSPQVVPCCAFSAQRLTKKGLPVSAGSCGSGVEPVGSHADPERCSGLADVSRDGVLDLAASMREFVRDVFEPYDAPCWGGPGIAKDPSCIDDASTDHVLRGAPWNDAPVTAPAAARTSNGPGGTRARSRGFRCAYPGVAP